MPLSTKRHFWKLFLTLNCGRPRAESVLPESHPNLWRGRFMKLQTSAVHTSLPILMVMTALGGGGLAASIRMRKLPQVLENVEIADRGAIEGATIVWDVVDRENVDGSDCRRKLNAITSARIHVEPKSLSVYVDGVRVSRY